MAVVVHLLGTSPYGPTHALQRALVDARAAGRAPDVILLLEHAPVVTIGRARGARANVVRPDGIEVVEVERGGDVTWHGPGQLVAYPILQLAGKRADLHLHLRCLEEAMIRLLADHGLAATRDPRNTGVWLPQAVGLPRKVGSVGIACRRWVSWHGLALNVAPDLASFERIRPCGFDPDTVTRLSDHLGWTPSVQALAAPLAAHLSATLEVDRDGPIRYAERPEDVLELLT